MAEVESQKQAEREASQQAAASASTSAAASATPAETTTILPSGGTLTKKTGRKGTTQVIIKLPETNPMLPKAGSTTIRMPEIEKASGASDDGDPWAKGEDYIAGLSATRKGSVRLQKNIQTTKKSHCLRTKCPNHRT